MEPEHRFDRYRELQRYVGWTDEDARRLTRLEPIVRPLIPNLIDDFYRAIEQFPNAWRVVTGGPNQIERLKKHLRGWLDDLLSGRYDDDYVASRWRVGSRHVETGLEQVYTNVALSRLRAGLTRAVQERWVGSSEDLAMSILALNKLLDLDLAIIEDAYQAAFSERRKRTERLATLGQVAGGVAHELRNPLNVVKTSVYFLLRARNPSPEKTAEHLQRIERHVALADSVITSLSSFARMPIPTLQPNSLPKILRQVLEINPPGPGIETVLDLRPDLPAVLADAAQIQVVFGNLIRNARDAMPDGGRLSITAHARDGRVEVQVVDTGVGISRDGLQRVFEPLYSTKTPGIGLGLAIVRSILEKCGGAIRVDSEPGLGSTFTVQLVAEPTRREVTS